MITSTGKNLSVLICSDYTFMFNWMSFASWYSVSKNLPDAKISILSARNNINLELYKWTRKIDAKFFMHRNVGLANNMPYLNKIYSVYVALKEGLVEQPLLVLDADMMAVRELSSTIVDQLNGCNFGTNVSKLNVGSIWYLNNQSLEKIVEVINTIKSLQKFATDQELLHLDLFSLAKVLGEPFKIENLCSETYEQNIAVFAHYREKCGNFLRKDYEKGLIYPPFIDPTLRTIDMTPNERKIFGLWAQMHLLFEALSK